LTINTNRSLRKFVLEKSDITIVNFYAHVFESAAVDSAVVIFTNNQSRQVVLLYEYTDALHFIKKVEDSSMMFSVQKTLSLWKRGRSIQQIAKERGVKESTIWSHFANLIEFNQLSVWKLLGKEKTETILCKINSETDKLKDIKARIKTSVTYDEIACGLSYVKSKNRTKNIIHHVHFYQKVYCFRKCYFNKNQRKACSLKFDQLISSMLCCIIKA